MPNMPIIALPILFPVVMIIVFIIVRQVQLARQLGILGSLILLAISVLLFFQVNKQEILVLYVGGWKAPYGITLVSDMFASLMLVVSSLIAVCISIYAYKRVDDDMVQSKFYLFFFSLLMGVNGAFLTGDIFNLYVWFELMLMSSFVLLTLGGKKEQLEGGIKYMAMNLVGSLMFLIGLGLLYGKTGTLNMAHLAQILGQGQNALLMNTSAVLFFVAFGIKAAVFPLFFWLPASYHTADNTVTSLFAGLLTKVGVYVLFRCFTLFFVQDQEFWSKLILIIAGFTMLIGGMAASVYYDSRKILSYHIISQIGYMLLGLGIATPLAISGAIYFTIHNMLAKTNTFLVAGLIKEKTGCFDLKSSGGLFKQNPFMAVLFVIPAFALAGVPPISGFFAKFFVVKAGFEAGHYVITTMAVFTGLLTLYSMIKIWFEAFLKPAPEGKEAPEKVMFRLVDYLPSLVLGLASIALGIFASYFFKLTMKASVDLVDPIKYVEAVLNGV